MPTYKHFKTATVNPATVKHRMSVQAKLGVPYTEQDLALAEQRYASQARLITADLAAKSVTLSPDSEMAAVIAYLQRLGRGPQPLEPAPPAPAPPGKTPAASAALAARKTVSRAPLRAVAVGECVLSTILTPYSTL